MNPFDPHNEDAIAVLGRELQCLPPEELEKPVEVTGKFLLQVLELLKTLIDEAHRHDGYDADGAPSRVFEEINDNW